MGTHGDAVSGDQTARGDLEGDINQLMELIQAGCPHVVLHHLDSTQIDPDSCSQLFKNEECQARGKYRGPVLEAAECGHVDVMNVLISRGFSPREVNLRDEFKTQPIHVGSSMGHLDIVKALVEKHGISVDETDNELNTPLFYCFLNCNPNTYDIVKYLLESGACVNWQMSDQITPLQECVAATESTPELCQLLITFGAEVSAYSSCTPLYLAAKKNRVDLIKVLLEAGADINTVSSYQTTPIITAAKYNCLASLKYLHFRGANTEHEDKCGDTALHVAAQKGFYDIAKYLIAEAGVSVGRRNKYDETPLLKAVGEVNTGIVDLLLKSGYKPRREEIDYYNKHFLLRIKGGKELLEWLHLSLAMPRTLQELCIFQVRLLLGRNPSSSVPRLPVPQKLKNLILLKYL